jgi:hypothetical protein
VTELKFDKTPKIVLVSEDGNGMGTRLYVDGKEIHGLKSIKLDVNMDRPIEISILGYVEMLGDK